MPMYLVALPERCCAFIKPLFPTQAHKRPFLQDSNQPRSALQGTHKPLIEVLSKNSPVCLVCVEGIPNNDVAHHVVGEVPEYLSYDDGGVLFLSQVIQKGLAVALNDRLIYFEVCEWSDHKG